MLRSLQIIDTLEVYNRKFKYFSNLEKKTFFVDKAQAISGGILASVIYGFQCGELNTISTIHRLAL
jgi:hypothetical protein